MLIFMHRAIVLAISAITVFIVLFRFYGDVPVEYYRNYGPGEAIAPVTNNNDIPQPGYFKAQPEWDWSVPKYANSWDGYARTPKNRDIVVLTASDGGGHNSAIPNVLERVLDDREKYCAKHGYTNLWLNTSRYDIGDAHRVSLRQEPLCITRLTEHLRHGPKSPPSPKPFTSTSSTPTSS
jgi:hypothetical protein